MLCEPSSPERPAPHIDSAHIAILEHDKDLARGAHRLATSGQHYLGNLHKKLLELQHPLVLDTITPTVIIESTVVTGPAILITSTKNLHCEDRTAMESGKASYSELRCMRVYIMAARHKFSLSTRGETR